jgi:transcriptional regulator with XRE-family HTH domain
MSQKRVKMHDSDTVRGRLVLVMKRIISSHPDVRSRTAFAKRIQTISPTISRWEKHRGNPTLENCINLCKEFSVSADWLLLGIGSSFGSPEILQRLHQTEERLKNIEKKLRIKSSKTDNKKLSGIL